MNIHPRSIRFQHSPFVSSPASAELSRKVRKNIDQSLDQHLAIRNHYSSEVHNYVFHTSNILMLSVLESAKQALKQSGFDVKNPGDLPENIDHILKEGIEALWESPVLAKWQINTDSALLRSKLKVESINLGLHDIRQLQQYHSHSKTPFSRLKPDNHWRMCIDPIKIDYIEKYMPHARDNPLLPFILDNDPSWLHGMLSGWAVTMAKTNPDVPLNTDLIRTLFSSCMQPSSGRGNGFSRELESFSLSNGSNMTPAGRTELAAFTKQWRQLIPNYALVSSVKEYNALLNKLEGVPVDQREAIWSGIDISRHDTLMLIRPALKPEHMEKLVTHFLAEFQKHIGESHNDSDKLHCIVELCQTLERLHPFADGNCRTFCILLLNNLLTRYGLPMTMVDNPNLFDGWSVSETVEKVIEGQQRVAAWMDR